MPRVAGLFDTLENGGADAGHPFELASPVKLRDVALKRAEGISSVLVGAALKWIAALFNSSRAAISSSIWAI